jgi:hypothetical protein
MIRVVSLLLALAFIPMKANAQNTGLWYFSYVEGDSAGDLTSCNANFDYANAFLSARFFGNDLDFIYYRDDFTLPFDQTLGQVIFRIDRVAFILTASTNPKAPQDVMTSSRIIFLQPSKSDYSDLYNAFRNGNRFSIDFPNGDTYEFPLNNSNRAFGQASECWASRPTGPFNNNPFVPPSAANNPFQTL